MGRLTQFVSNNIFQEVVKKLNNKQDVIYCKILLHMLLYKLNDN